MYICHFDSLHIYHSYRMPSLREEEAAAYNVGSFSHPLIPALSAQFPVLPASGSWSSALHDLKSQ